MSSLAAALFGLGGIYLRRRVSRNWIDYRQLGPADLDGRVIVITGANVGLGYESAKEFVKRNGTVVLACRDVAKAEEAAKRIVKSIGGGTGTRTGSRPQNVLVEESMDCMEVDLASLESVRTFASRLTAKYPSIYALVCNAGVWVPMEEERKTRDGYEIHFGVNHLGHFALIKSVVDHMAKSKEECRIVLVSSGLLKGGKIDMDKQDFVYEGRKVAAAAAAAAAPEPAATEEGTSTSTASDGAEEALLPNNDDERRQKKQKKHASFAPTGYCDSKLMNALTARQLAAALGKTAPHVSTYAVCPGFCRTSLGRHVSFPFYKKIMFAPIMLMIQRTCVQGSQNIVHATLEEKENMQSGSMYRDGEVAKDETEFLDSLDKDLPKKLWDLSEKLLGKK